ncbi:MAG TPA: ATP-binding protein [Acidobacteriaceae bacterium]|nr:ATP-binding protein [Acidobacteriaceae bacterium]
MISLPTAGNSIPCPLCAGTGLQLVRRNGEQFAAECVCRADRKAGLRMKRARIPERYAHCSLESFDTGFRSADPSLGMALMATRRFADGYPLETEGRGLLLTGSFGVGKTHLAVGLLRELIEQRGATGIFCDYRDLLKQIQNSYNPHVATTELEILRPVFETEVLLLDELGAVKKTDWVWDTVAHILNTRYNDKKTTLVTTNYPNILSALSRGREPAAFDVTDKGVAKLPKGSRSQAQEDAERAMREETLGDRIGDRMLSRLQEMCITISMHGEDFRQTVRRASFL